MATLKSTMNAPLTDTEENEILDAWDRLVYLVGTIDLIKYSDTVKMLDFAADVVGHISELRTAVYNGWHHANARAFPAPFRRGNPLSNRLSKLDEFKGYTKEEIQAALKTLF